MLEHLEALGLTGYEARALDHLLRHGERTGPALSREADIPFGRVYDTLNALVERGLATAKAGRPRSFAAAATASIPGRLLASHKRRLQEEERELGQHAAALEGELSRLAPRKAPGSTLYGVRLGEDASRDFLVEATHEAKSRIEAYLAFEHLQDDDLALFDAFRQAVVRGVRTRLLLRGKDVDYLLSTPYVSAVLDAMAPHLGQGLQVRLSDTDNLSFSVLDGERVVLGVKNPLDPRIYFAVVHMDDRAFAEDLVGKFETLWREASIDDDLAIFDAFRQAVGRGVKTRLLLRRKDVDYLLSTPYVPQVIDAMLPHLGENLQVRLSPTDNLSFSVLDGERVVLGVKNPLDPRIYFAVVHMDDKAFAADLVGKFDALWRDGEFDEGLAKTLLGRKSGRALLKIGAKLRR